MTNDILLDIKRQLRIANILKILELKTSEFYDPESKNKKKMDFTDNIDSFEKLIHD